MKKNLLLAVILILTTLFTFGCGSKEDAPGSTQAGVPETNTQETDKQETDKQETDNQEASKTSVEIEIENYGTIKAELDAQQAPLSVENFITLAKDGFYDGLTFHRIMKGFMMQGGDPSGNGSGGSDKTIKGEFANNGVENTLSHTKGAISMARSMDMDSASSQFFIVHEDSLFLDNDYAVFGYVTEGMEIIDEICNSAEPSDDNGTIPPADQPVITSVKVIE